MNDKKKDKKVKTGSFRAICDLMKEIFGVWNKKNIKLSNIKQVDKKTWIAIGITAIIVISIGVILWAIPFTRPWIKEFLFIQ